MRCLVLNGARGGVVNNDDQLLAGTESQVLVIEEEA